MSTLGWIGIVAWVVLGLPIGIVVSRLTCTDDELRKPMIVGFSVICSWILAPAVVIGALMASVCWLIGRVTMPTGGKRS